MTIFDVVYTCLCTRLGHKKENGKKALGVLLRVRRVCIVKHGDASVKHHMSHICRTTHPMYQLSYHGAFCGPNRYPDGTHNFFLKKISCA